MYIIKKISVDDKVYQSSKIIDHTNKKISSALVLLENCARNFVKEEFGARSFEQSKVLDIHKIDQVCEPIIDGMLLYRLNDDPHRIHIYQRRTEVIDNGWIRTYHVPQSTFRKTHIFELEECTDFKLDENKNSKIPSDILEVEMVVGPAGIKIPEPMTHGPSLNLLNDLKKSPKFKERFISGNTIINNKSVSVIKITEEKPNLKMSLIKQTIVAQPIESPFMPIIMEEYVGKDIEQPTQKID